MLNEIKNSANYVLKQTNLKPQIGIILGTGLGSIANSIEKDVEIDYADIPGFPVSTVVGHKGKLLIGTLNGIPVAAMQGRFHFYEGYDMNQVAFPVRVMKFMGIENLIVSNASGGLNPDFEIGDIMAINDHINLFPTNPLIGPNMDQLGPRFPDMSEAYKISYIESAMKIASDNGFKLHQGVYAGLTGPTFETPAEYKYIRIIGADAVGMSTVPEVIAAKHMSMNVFGLSVITDLGVEGSIVEVSHAHVIENAKKNEKNLVLLVEELVKTMH